jgi:Tfp pilus assembly protein PilO
VNTTLLFQVATPPPLPPLSPGLSPGMQEQVLIVVVIVVITVATAWVLAPLFRAWARRIEGRSADPQLQGEVDQLREQIAELEPLRGRIHELEERIEFAERLLAQRRDQELLPPAAQRSPEVP